jgi:hypothetical protein
MRSLLFIIDMPNATLNLPNPQGTCQQGFQNLTIQTGPQADSDMARANTSTPGASPGVSLFLCRGDAKTEARIGCGCDLGPSSPALPLIQDDGL